MVHLRIVAPADRAEAVVHRADAAWLSPAALAVGFPLAILAAKIGSPPPSATGRTGAARSPSWPST